MSSKQLESPLASKGINSVQAQHLRSIDRKIRKKWNLLYCYRKGRMAQQGQESIHGRKLYTEPAEPIAFQHNMNPHQVQHRRSNQNRELTSLRIQKNNDIFFRKQTHDPQSASLKVHYVSTSPNQISEFMLEQGRERGASLRKNIRQEMRLPLMLQKRGKKLEKEMSIIEHLSCEKLKRIKERESLKLQLNRQEQDRLIGKLKGTKLYYKFIQEWKMPVYEEKPPHSHSTHI